MDSWEFNKIAAAVLSALLVIFGGRELMVIAGGGHAAKAAKPGFTLPVDVESAGNKGGTQVAKKGFDYAEFAKLLPTASAGAGEKSFKKCSTCHTPQQGGKNGQGPNLWNIVNRDLGKAEGFKYSKALLAKGGKWDFEALAGFIHKPKKWLKGTKMAFAGVRDQKELADILAYLRSLSDDPAPIPGQ